MMSTPKLPITASMDTSTKVMGLALRDVNASLAGSLGIAEGTIEYMYVGHFAPRESNKQRYY